MLLKEPVLLHTAHIYSFTKKTTILGFIKKNTPGDRIWCLEITSTHRMSFCWEDTVIVSLQFSRK